MKKTILIIISFFILILVWYATYTNLQWSIKNSDTWETDNDTWSFEGDYTYLDLLWNSVSQWTVVAKIKWEIQSWLYWDFYFWINSTDEIEFIKSNDTTLCNWDTTYTINWKIHSEWAWANMDFVDGSYYCPSSNSFLWIVYSDLLWYKYIWNLVGIWNLTNIWWTIVLDPSNQNTWWDVVSWAAFNLEDSILVKWLLWKDKNQTAQVTWDQVNNELNNDQDSVILEVDIYKAKLDSYVNRNIEKLTRNVKSINERYYIDSSDLDNWVIDSWSELIVNSLMNNDKDIYYFNYEWQENISASNEDNKWEILEIRWWTYDPSDFTDYQVWVNWHKTVIVKWGNIYINSDIYNSDTNSILVLVAKRDDDNNNNWWNIYINPNVTNIDAVIIAEWSIINYDWSSVVTNKDSLMNQLYIYWSVFTKNSIWSTESPYWSDGYISYPNNLTIWAEKYDLWKLRYFSLILSKAPDSEWVTWLNCLSEGWSDYLVSRSSSMNNDLTPRTFAWAWKRKCYNQPWKEDSIVTNLRWSNKFNPLIVDYNTMIKINPPDVLKEN